MKNSTALLLLCCLVFSIPLVAQTESSLQELLERKNKTTHECVTTVFTPEEIAILRAHFGHPDGPTVINKMGPKNSIYGIENVSERYGSFNAADPSTFTHISNSPIVDPNFEGAGAISEDGEMAYVIDNNNNLYKLVILTGIYTLLGVLTPPAGMSFTGLEFDPITGALFALATDAVQTVLMTINVITIVATLIGITGMVLGIALAASPLGELFAVDIDNDSLYKINKITALATLIGFIGFNANFAQGMALSFLTGVVLFAAFNNTVFDSELRSVDLLTGLTTLIGVIVIGSLVQFGWIGAPNPELGLADNANRLFDIFPNPAGDSVFLESQNTIESISVYDMMGRRVLYQPVDAMNSEVNISYLAAGQYVCTALVNGETGTYKIIKQ
jgi:hypothetical protein